MGTAFDIMFKNGAIEDVPSINIERVPYIAFSFDEETGRMLVQTVWASLCGYGWDIVFNQSGEVLNNLDIDV